MSIFTRKLNAIDLQVIRKVAFGFGISRGGMHAWLLSEGYVYAVHWDQVGPNLYNEIDIQLFPWQSNLIAVLPDAKINLSVSSVDCKKIEWIH